MNLPRYLQLTDVAITMDGGTYSFSAIDENNVPHQICLIQHAFYPAIIDVAAIPGRLYFDRELIDIRSPSEQAVISLLTNACDSAEGSICSICRKMIGFVSSVDYLRCADRLEQMADLTRYDVWLSFENLDRRQAIVGLSRLRGVSVRIAREIIDNEHPIAQQLPAAAVADLFILYRSNGFDLKTKPPFPWCS